MILLPRDFKEFLNLLADNQVKYLIVGGYAVAHYGYIRATNDIDIWVATDEDNRKRIARAVELFGFPPGQIEQLLLSPDQIIRMGVPPLQIELLTTISGVEFDKCYQRKNQIIIGDLQLVFIDREDLKKNKLSAARHKDLDDAEHL